ncbi:MAG: hypothetical protein HDT44_05795 [Ruminococcaceae bacterium]|nr:hypothetical protein [Oscillospiraceae bacterium]
MTLSEFIEINNIALFVEGNLKENRFDITYTAVSLENQDLFEQLILHNTPKSLWKYLSKQELMPRMWQQGSTKCVMCRSDSPKRIFAAFYNSEQDVREDWRFAQKVDSELKEIFLY